ncbi:MAG: S8 family serine peptidase [Flaviflexus sp.]|uniref:S8 family serine peptidase n=1 Tax=Flaviflexus sp. TaxID=1969482 RepID=UPI003F8FC456
MSFRAGRRGAAAAALLAVSLSWPVSAVATTEDETPAAPERWTSFNDIACPPQSPDDEEPPEGRLSSYVLGLPSAHELSTGEGVRIGLLDSGINTSHVTLENANIDEGVDLTDSDDATDDEFGSGTTYASFLVGSSDGQYPVHGVAPEATLVPIKIIDQVPENMSQQYVADMADKLTEGINWAVDNDIDIAVTALALPTGSPELEEAVREAEEAGVLIIAPGGELTRNEDEDEASLRFPAAYESVLSVTAVTSAGGSVQGMLGADTIDIAAPGQNIPGASNASSSATCVVGKAYPSSLNASINAAGVAALVISAHPDETPAQIAHRLETTAIRPGADRRTSSTSWGIINPSGAIAFIDDGTAHGPVSPAHGEQPEPEFIGREPIAVEPDPQRMTKPMTWIGLAGGGALALALLLGAAGLWRGRNDSSDNEK